MLDFEECWFSNSSFNWFGHQSRLDVPLLADLWNGHLLTSLINLFLSLC